MKRRRFMRNMGLAALGTALYPASSLARGPDPEKRRVAVFSDIHIGREWNGIDGADWFEMALADIFWNVGPVSYAITLGDITHEGDLASLEKYKALRESSAIPCWFEIAGNHDHWNRGIRNYRRVLGNPAPHVHIDGNIAWFLVSTESSNCAGYISRRNIRWLERSLARHANKVRIVCTHQPPYRTVRKSSEPDFCLHPRWRIRNLVKDRKIDLFLCGHEHHEPYSGACMDSLGGTTLINAASTSHAYGTGFSESLTIDLEEESKIIRIRRRHHDGETWADEFEMEVPLRNRISLKKRPRPRKSKGATARSWRVGRRRRTAPSR